MKITATLLFFLLLGLSVQAQDGFPNLDELSFDLKYCGGTIYKHTKKVYLEPPPYSQEVELSITHRTYGKRKWERINNCPAPSINFCYSQFGDQLGNAISFYPGIEWAVLRKQKMNWVFKIGGGLGLASERWTRQDTIKNYLGSRLNNFTTIQTALNFKLSEKLDIQAGGRMSHTSNGAVRIPNYGINLFSGFVDLNYYPEGRKKMILEKPAVADKRIINVGSRTGIGWGEQNAPDGALSGIYSQSVFVATPFLRKHRIYAGTDITYSGKAYAGYSYALIDDNLRWSATSTTVFVGLELLYGRVGIPFQFGVFTKKIRNQTSKWYQKMGFQYYIYRNDETLLKRLSVGPLLKSNKINADYLEFCIGAMF